MTKYIGYLGPTPAPPVTLATSIITSLVGNSQKKLYLPLLLGGGVDPNAIPLTPSPVNAWLESPLSFTRQTCNIWLVVSTHLKTISHNGNLPQVEVKTKNIWNHQPCNSHRLDGVLPLFPWFFFADAKKRRSNSTTPRPPKKTHGSHSRVGFGGPPGKKRCLLETPVIHFRVPAVIFEVYVCLESNLQLRLQGISNKTHQHYPQNRPQLTTIPVN